MANAIRFFKLNTGAQIPSIGLGTGQADPAVFGNAVTIAVKAGYRHIDCAQAYDNEKEVGSALKKLFEEGVVKREDLWITSKLWCTNNAPEDVSVALNSTLEDLQLDYIDLYLGYSPLGSRGTTWIKGDVLKHPILNTVAEKLGKTPAQVALRWGLQMGHSVLPMSTNETRIKENIDLFDWSIPEDLFAKFSEIDQEKLVSGSVFVNEKYGAYKNVEELWDGEI